MAALARRQDSLQGEWLRLAGWEPWQQVCGAAACCLLSGALQDSVEYQAFGGALL